MQTPVPSSLFDDFARGWRGYVLIALIALANSLMGATRIGVMDVDEARFAQATRQMIETGDYVRIRLQDEERNRKPIGIHWLQAASVRAFEPITGRINTIWPYRAPSALGVMLAALAALWGGSALIGPRAAFLGAGLFASGVMIGIEGMTAKTDAMLVGFTTLALAALARLHSAAWRAPENQKHARALAILFWIALACGVLIKGPVTPLAAALTLTALAAWERRANWMKVLLWWPGPALATLIALPWLIAIGVATEGRFYVDLFGSELGPKLVGQDHAHGGLPGYHLVLLPFLIFPATYALPAAARLGWRAVAAPHGDASQAAFRFLIAWAAPTFVAFELFPGKLPHYTLPVYPAIALLCGAGLMALQERRWRTAHPAGAVMFAVVAAVLVLMMGASASLMPGDFSADLRRAVSAGLIGAGAMSAALAALIMLRRPAARAAVLIACGLLFSFSVRERLLPEARSVFVTNETAAALTRARLMGGERPLWVVGYDEVSIVFVTRTSTRLATPGEVGAGARPGDAIVVEGREMDETAAALAARDLAFRSSEPAVRGLSLGSGDRVALFVGRVEAISSAGSAGGPPPDP
jgi:4-amino-4-deoxy-L-arabinose transferase-like glycosyltransferase